MRTILALATIPAALCLAVARPTSPPIVAAVTEPEGVRAARQDDATFRLRWSVVSDLPPATTLVRTQRVERTSDSLQPNTTMAPAAARVSPALSSRAPTRVRRASLPLDLCGQHRMRKVWVSSRRWRCRR